MISSPAGRAAQENADVVTALVSLGYSVMETTRAVNSLPTGKKLSLEEKVKLALQYLGK
jgi:Holliday junction resolvasome RuvABC DNA-binding subunit